MNDGGDCRTAPATPGLLIIFAPIMQLLLGGYSVRFQLPSSNGVDIEAIYRFWREIFN